MSIQLYCPICLKQLTDVNDCWTPCQYEVSEDFPPLSRLQMLSKRIEDKNNEVRVLKGQLIRAKGDLAYLNEQLKETEKDCGS